MRVDEYNGSGNGNHYISNIERRKGRRRGIKLPVKMR